MGCGCTSLQEFSGYLFHNSAFLKYGREGEVWSRSCALRIVRIDILFLCESFIIMNFDASIPSYDLKNHGRPLSASACVWLSFLCSTTEVRIFHYLCMVDIYCAGLMLNFTLCDLHEVLVVQSLASHIGLWIELRIGVRIRYRCLELSGFFCSERHSLSLLFDGSCAISRSCGRRFDAA